MEEGEIEVNGRDHEAILTEEDPEVDLVEEDLVVDLVEEDPEVDLVAILVHAADLEEEGHEVEVGDISKTDRGALICRDPRIWSLRVSKRFK